MPATRDHGVLTLTDAPFPSAEYTAGYPSWEEHLTAAVAAAADDTARAAAGLQLATALGLDYRLADAARVAFG